MPWVDKKNLTSSIQRLGDVLHDNQGIARHLPGTLAMTRRRVSCVTFAISWRIAFLRLLMSRRVWVKTWAFKYPHKKVCCSKIRWIGGQRACAQSVGDNGRATLCAQQLIPWRFAVCTGENATDDGKFVAQFCPTSSRVGNAAALIDVDSSPRLFSHAGYFQVTWRCFDGYGL